MATTTAVRTHSTGTRSAPSAPTRTAPPPPTPRATPNSIPAPALDLRAADTVMGWIDGRAIGFRGFADEEEAAHAAWVAYRTMSRRFAREGGQRLVPIDTVPMSLSREGDVELILAAERPIATLVRPGSDSPSGPDSFGFELQVPKPVDELTMRSTAYLVYRTLRRSGIRWAMWAPATPAPSSSASPSSPSLTDPSRAEPSPMSPTAAPTDAARATRRRDATRVLGTVLIVFAVLSVVILPAITASMVIPLLGGAAGLVALAALASLVHWVATDVRDRLREPRRPMRPTPSDNDRLSTPARMAA